MIKQLFLGAIITCSLWSCTKTELNTPMDGITPEEGKAAVTITLSSNGPLQSASTVAAKSPVSKATVTTTNTNETLVSDLMVLQYNMQREQGELVSTQKIYATTQDGSSVRVSVSLEPMEKTRIVVLANITDILDDSKLSIGSSLEDLNNITFDINSLAGSGIPEDNSIALPMRSESEDMTLTAGTVSVIKLTLGRLVSRVNFTLQNNCTSGSKRLSITSVTLRNVPAYGTCERILESTHANNRWITSDANNFKDYKSLSAEQITGAETSYLWYMAPNNGGIGTGNTAEDKMKPSNVPSNFCSFIEVNGDVIIQETPHAVSYRLYLGKNNTNDYNVWANEAYNVQLTINSLPDNPEDLVTGADGFRIEMRATEMHSNTIEGWNFEVSSGTVTPDPATIASVGGEYLVTLHGNWQLPASVPVRLWDVDQSRPLSQGQVTYSASTQGGSAILSIPENNAETMRNVQFQYEWRGEWVSFQLGQQRGTLVDVGATMLLEAQDPNYACTWEEAIQYCSEKGEGWRLPTSNELLFYWCITPALISDEERFITDRHYWSARKYENKSIVAFYTSNGQIHKNYAATSNEPGIGGTISREIMPTDKNYVRCVKPANRDNSYPKFEIAKDGGIIVVLRDNNGGLDEATLFSAPVSKTLTGDEQSEDNRMSRRFRVQKTTNTQVTAKLQAVNLKNYCDTLTLDGYDNWRVPSQREMMLLFAIGASNYVQNGDADNTGVSSGQALVPTYLHQQEGMTPFETTSSYGGYIAATGVNIRNSTNRWTVYMGEYTSGASGYTGDRDTGYYTRCIRDEW